METYVMVVNYLDERAIRGELLNETELDVLNNLDGIEDTTQFIADIADANDCGICSSWNELVAAFAELFKSGERIRREAI